MVDNHGNRMEVGRQKIAFGVQFVKKRCQLVIIRCDYGVSRSNTVVVGINKVVLDDSRATEPRDRVKYS